MGGNETTYTFEDRLFRRSLLISLGAHILLLAGLAYAHVVSPQPQPLPRPEIVYHLEARERPAPPESKPAAIKPIKDPDWRPPPKILQSKELAQAPVLMEAVKQPSQLVSHQKQPARIPSPDSKRHIDVPLLNSEKISNPNYLNYHDRVRSRIRDRAYFFVDHPDFRAGKVYLTFVLKSDGSLKAVQIIKEKTQANDFLCSIGLRSIKESAPFPPFPPDLSYPELSFNIVISFEVDE